MVCVVLAYGTRTVVRNPVWSDNETLFDTTLRDHPENFRAHWFRALRLDREGDPAGSRRSWERAMEIYPGDVAFLTDYALFLLSAGETGRAAAIVDMALELRPEGVSSIYVKGLTDVARGRSDDALEQASRLRTLGFRAIAEELEDSVRSSTRAR
jgi:Tfp pilus assembly protein PilF